MARRFKVVFDAERCKGCELCSNFCPKHIISMEAGTVNSKGYHPAAVTDMAACIGCSSCALMCPDCCISIYELEEGEEA